jgi:hypothetical protein
MNQLVEAIRVAGVVQLVIIAVNLLLPGKLQVREQLATAPRFIRQIFYAHWAYIVLVLGLFSALCLAFPAELAGACGLGRFLSAFLATFWLSRLAVQWAYYDRDMRRANRTLDSLYSEAVMILSIVFGLAAGLGGGHVLRW